VSTRIASPNTGALLMATGVLVAALTASCGLASPSSPIPPCQTNSALACTVVDGYPVGELARDCGPDGGACGDIGLLARLALDAREPSHPAPTAAQQYGVDMARVCGPALCAFTAAKSIVVFTFADGEHMATGYECYSLGPCVGTLTWGGFGNAVAKPTR